MKKTSIDANKKVFKELGKLTNKFSECLTKDEKKYVCNEEWTEAYFYGLPKLHKSKEVIDKIREEGKDCIKMNIPSSLKTRPICGGPNAVTQGASKLLHEILSPLVPVMKSYIKDEWDFVRRFPRHVSFDATLLSCDIVSLYTSIPIELGLEALEYWIKRLRNQIPSRFTIEFILQKAEFVLEKNYCIFFSEMFRQII